MALPIQNLQQRLITIISMDLLMPLSLIMMISNRHQGMFLASGGAITWKSKKQTTIALSSKEAEYVALSEAAREACWLRNLYYELGYTQESQIILKGDNDGSIAMAKNQQFHNQSKHIVIRWHWVRDLVEEQLIKIETCRDPQQTADVLTKPLPRPKHSQHVSEMGLAST